MGKVCPLLLKPMFRPSAMATEWALVNVRQPHLLENGQHLDGVSLHGW